jgi:hypothetical protein
MLTPSVGGYAANGCSRDFPHKGFKNTVYPVQYIEYARISSNGQELPRFPE